VKWLVCKQYKSTHARIQDMERNMRDSRCVLWIVWSLHELWLERRAFVYNNHPNGC